MPPPPRVSRRVLRDHETSIARSRKAAGRTNIGQIAIRWDSPAVQSAILSCRPMCRRRSGEGE
jgi:hypothetical protein